MKQFYALFLFLIAFLPATGNTSALSNSEDFNCTAFANYQVDITVVSGTSKCKGQYEGELRAQIRNGSGQAVNTGNFEYTWYYADHMFDNNYRVSIGKDAKKLAPGTYNVVVVDSNTGCRIFGQAQTINKSIDPCFKMAEGYPRTILGCNKAPIGQVFLENCKNYKIEWYNGLIIDKKYINNVYTSQDYNYQIAPGTYTIIAIDESTGCESDPYVFTVEGWPIPPVVNASILADTTCAGNGSGRISLTSSTPAPGTEPELGYTYQWRNSSGTLLSQFTNQATASPLPSGTYTVTVTGNYNNDNFECSTTTSFTVPHQPVNPIASYTSSPNSICDPASASSGVQYNGSITGSATYKGVTVTNFSNYTFTWTHSDGTTGSVTGTNLMPNLKGGTYTVVARNNSLGCNAAPVSVTVQNTLPSQSLTLSATPQTSCNGTPNGAISASYSISPASSGSVSYRWFLGSTATGTPISSGTATMLSNLAGGQTYTVEATDAASGCRVVRSIVVPMQQGVVTATLTPTPNSICSPATAKNGGIALSELRFNGTVVTDLSGYTFQWYREVSGSFHT
ncbi:hypothetical protein, partial [Cesiribacter andamanensis]|uniref:hypothetical protein n=1 Tax=Cesiribacter andamanensis TaxID=649507 RepID=UPI00058F00DA